MGLFDIFSGGGSSRKSFSDLSDNWEKRKEAREYNARAREIIDDYTERYETTYYNTQDYAFETQRRLDKHNDFKKEIIRKLQLDVKPVLDDFKKFDIDSKTIDIDFSDIGSNKNLDMSISNINNTFARFDRLSFNNCFPNLDDIFRDATEEYYQAKSNYNQAKMYKSQIQLKREQLKTIKSNLSNIRSYISDEERVLSELMERIEGISNKLDQNMKKSSFKKEESEHLKAIYKIAKGIDKMMGTRFLNDDFTVTDDYNSLFEKMKEINSLIEKPTLNTGELDRILKSIGVIVY
ncbi:MAG: hypothetical protein MR593_00820 [Intestinibacter sp.]|uniref:hypothetical protein n=1 Tax=Intestinibacter sp. TaxID=1965304 RepID=UPI0025C37532|nr:hypothetical protein [Intestinibacter sp.]MCI6736652.1 hypothetical protein [Intestinibacter sp.]